jgi:hypothetical protein
MLVHDGHAMQHWNAIMEQKGLDDVLDHTVDISTHTSREKEAVGK